MVPDRTGRFPERPHYRPEELDRECERIVSDFLKDLHDRVAYPVDTDDLVKLLERDAGDLDGYADLSDLGDDVEGVTEFYPGRKPTVRISADLANDDRRENRLRTTLTHEYGHVHFHAYLWDLRAGSGDDMVEPSGTGRGDPSRCKRDTMLEAGQADWMEWQAGYVCGAMLMPISPVKRIVGAYQERYNLFGPVAPESEHGRALIGRLVEAFQVSDDAARVRLLKLNHLGKDHGPSLFG
jgi:hypothetical protein